MTGNGRVVRSASMEVNQPEPGKREKLTIELIDAYKRRGLNQTEIARLHGITRQAVSFQVRKYDRLTDTQRLLTLHFPWRVPQHQGNATQFRRLRDHGRHVATAGKVVPPSERLPADLLDRLQSFYRKLRDENIVVEHDPTLPPEPGVAAQGGWAYRPRLPEDGNLMIRVNEYTTLTDEGRTIWQLPGGYVV
ncbi:XRE family transcriptional regulator [Mycolicibacterium sp.]|uniref:XRE family transcriptional regulator n=1 Tax=Mycolicibacterium sp. TaxID=2320850 RepID=UPI0037C8843E